MIDCNIFGSKNNISVILGPNKKSQQGRAFINYNENSHLRSHNVKICDQTIGVPKQFKIKTL